MGDCQQVAEEVRQSVSTSATGPPGGYWVSVETTDTNAAPGQSEAPGRQAPACRRDPGEHYFYAGVSDLAHSGRIRILVSASMTRCGLPRSDQTIRGIRDTASISGHASSTAREKLALGISS